MSWKIMGFMADLIKLIELIQNKYDEINQIWLKNNNYYPLNMKKYKVDDVYKNKDLLSHVLNYRNFVNEYAFYLTTSIQSLKINTIVNSRVKALNSIQFKIDNYEKNHENGKIPIKKCLNDIFGIRMIFIDELDYNKIINFVKCNYPKLRCINSDKGEYKAIHIYFGNDNNKNFRWELQLWDKKHEKSNLLSHSKYKQEYTKWESDKN